jgi:glycerol kinase
MKDYILVIDEGTTGVKSFIYDRDMRIRGVAYRAIESIYPGERKVEQNAENVYALTVETIKEVVASLGINPADIACAGLATQRTSWLLWDKKTGKPIHNMVIWQDTRGAFQQQKFIEDKTFNQYFPGVAQILPPFYPALVFADIKETVPGFAEAIKRDGLLWGNVDSWLLYNLTGGKSHATTTSMASNSVIFDSPSVDWNMYIPGYVGMRADMLPEVKDEYDDFGVMTADILGVEIPIYCIVADQQSAMFAQGCFDPAVAKCTNGSGTFINVNTGSEYKQVAKFFSSIAWRIKGKVDYMVEGSSYSAGTCLEWAQNNLSLFSGVEELTKISESVPDSGGVYFVPALGGMTGAPYNDYSARASFMGMGYPSTRAHMIRAVLDSVAYAAIGVVKTFTESGIDIKKFSVSGGVSNSDIAIQLMSNVLGMEILRPESVEATSLGAAELAAIRMGWIDIKDAGKYFKIDKVFAPNQNRDRDLAHFEGWKKAVERSTKWL